jgi:hypothetical protein
VMAARNSLFLSIIHGVAEDENNVANPGWSIRPVASCPSPGPVSSHEFLPSLLLLSWSGVLVYAQGLLQAFDVDPATDNFSPQTLLCGTAGLSSVLSPLKEIL